VPIVSLRALLDGRGEHMPRMSSGRVLDQQRINVLDVPGRTVLGAGGLDVLCVLDGPVFTGGGRQLQPVRPRDVLDWKRFGLHGVSRRPSLWRRRGRGVRGVCIRAVLASPRWKLQSV
jgi:hypothetical protein